MCRGHGMCRRMGLQKELYFENVKLIQLGKKTIIRNVTCSRYNDGQFQTRKE